MEWGTLNYITLQYETYLLSRTMLNLESPDLLIVLLIMSRWNTDLRASPLPTGGSVMNCQHSLWDDTISLKNRDLHHLIFISFLISSETWPMQHLHFFYSKAVFLSLWIKFAYLNVKNKFCALYIVEKKSFSLAWKIYLALELVDGNKW